jgi:pyridoxine 5-phosphate synthase
MPKLGVNVDHVATVRQARRENEPNPIAAALICEAAGAKSIVAHLREDRRHMQDKDIIELRKVVKTRFNLEMSLNAGIVQIALKIKPDQATLVPERRQEVTTEGGLDVVANFKQVSDVCKKLSAKAIDVSLFIDPDPKQIEATHQCGAGMIELHTGTYARAFAKGKAKAELLKIQKMTAYARSLGLIVHAGHGLNYENTYPIAQIVGMQELNIGHSIISRSIFVGLKQAVEEMLQIFPGGKR